MVNRVNFLNEYIFLKFNFLFYVFNIVLLIYLFFIRDREREAEGERNGSIDWLPHAHPLLGIQPGHLP